MTDCTYVGCERIATQRRRYWGELHELCEEHGDLIGDYPPIDEEAATICGT